MIGGLKAEDAADRRTKLNVNFESKWRIFMKSYLTKISISLMTLGLVGLVALTALAVPRPFHLVEHGSFTVDQDGKLDADGTGTATHLGHFTLTRTAKLTPTEKESVVDVEGEATLIAANGDRLEASIKGALNPLTNHAVLTYEWKGGTGRFQNASGAATWLVDLHLSDHTYDVIADGIINY